MSSLRQSIVSERVDQRHRRFAEEYSVDHNGAQAAIRAGYAVARAKQTAWRLLQKPDVAQMVARLDEEKSEELGISRRLVVQRAEHFIEGAMAGDYPGNVGMRALELEAKLLGLFGERSEHTDQAEVVYRLKFDRDLEAEGEQ